MKRIFCLIFSLIFLLFSMCSCGCQEPSHLVTIDDFYDYIENVEVDVSWSVQNTRLKYYAFEKEISGVTNVLKARFISVNRLVNGFYAYKFEVVKNLRGDFDRKYVFVIHTVSLANPQTPYEAGEQYLLLLKKTAHMYVQEDIFDFVENIFIPLDNNEKVLLDEATMYENKKLTDFIVSDELKNAIENGNFIDELLKMIENNPTEAEKNFPEFATSRELLEAAPYVMLVDAQKSSFDRYLHLVNDYECEVVEIYKGSYDKATFEIGLPGYAIKEGGRYIIAFEEIENSDGFRLYGRYAIFAESEREKIMDLLDACEKPA